MVDLHFIWQKPTQYCKAISGIKKKKRKKKKSLQTLALF